MRPPVPTGVVYKDAAEGSPEGETAAGISVTHHENYAAADPGLESLANQAQQLQAGVTDADVAGIPPEGAAPPGPTNAQIVAQLVGAVRDTVCMVADLDAPRRTLTDDKVSKLGDIWGGVLDHYGIRLSEKMGQYSVVLAALAASVPLVAPTVIETRREIAEKDAKRPPKQLAAPAGADQALPAAAPPRAAPAANAPGYTEGAIKPAFPGAS